MILMASDKIPYPLFTLNNKKIKDIAYLFNGF